MANNKKIDERQPFKIARKFAWIVVGAIIVELAHLAFKSPPYEPNVDVVYHTIEKTPYKYDPKGGLNIDYETDKDIFIICFRLTNDGNAKDTNLKIDIRTLKSNVEIEESCIFFNPPSLEDNEKKSFQISDKNQFHRLIDPFPANSQIYITLTFSTTISERDLIFSFLGDNKNWQPRKDKIDIRNPFISMKEYNEMIGVAYAQEPNKLQKEAELNSKLKSFWTGGYYPLLLSHDVFELLRSKGGLSHSEIEEIEKMIESFELVSKGVSFQGVSVPISSLFRGFSFTRFHEVILNALIKKKIFSIEEVQKIMTTSQEAGGTKISGYNFIILDVEILNQLLRKGYINRIEGQQIIDNAKVKK